MQDSRLIEILKAFTKEEIKSFELFLNSPFVKSRRNIKPMLELLIKSYPKFENPELNKEAIFKIIFPGEIYSEKRIINLMSDLTKESENFLKHLALDDDEVNSLILVSRGFYNKKLYDHSFRITKSLEKKLQPGFSPGKDFFSKLRQLTFLKSAYFTSVNDFTSMIECKKSYFEASAAQFIIDYIQMLSSRDPALMTYGKNFETNFINSVIESFSIDKLFKKIDKTEYSHKQLINIHYYLLKTIQIPEDKKYYFLMRDLFYGNLNEFDREEKYFLFNHLASYCSDEVSKKNAEFYKEALDVYKKMLENDAYSYSESEYMQVFTYRNIIFYCNTVKDSEWFKFFIEKYTDVIAPKHREDMRNFAYANLWFLNKEYEKSLKSISGITYEFFLFKPDLKNIMLKIYYELNYFEQAYSLIDTYKHFLSKTDEISDSYKLFYKNFVNRYLDLLKIKSGSGKENSYFIKKKIEKENKIVNKMWLLEKAGEL